MELLKNTLSLIVILIFVSCNTRSQSNNTIDDEITLNKKLKLLNKFNRYDTINHKTINKVYKIMDSTFFVEKILKSKGTDFFMRSNLNYLNDSDYSTVDISYSYYISEKDKSILVIYKHSTSSDLETNPYYKLNNSDTLYFKNNKLYFWKNKNPSKQEILAKEKEILTIKREIDSVLSE